MPEPKIVCYAPAGGQGTMRMLGDVVSSGAKNLTSYEMDCWKRACLMAQPANGGTLTTGKEFLEREGWTVYWDGAPEKLEARLEIRVTADEKAWILANGGSDMVRLLLRAKRDEQERIRASETTE